MRALNNLYKLFWLAIWLCFTGHQIAFAETLYEIKATFKPDNHQLDGQVLVHFTNTTKQPLKEVFFQLNANRKIKLTVSEVTDEQNLVLPAHFYRYPYLNRQKEDKTLFQVFLNQPLQAGKKVKLKLKYSLKHIPIQKRSTYLINDFNRKSTSVWYPKLADLTPSGWQATETSIADYKVNLTIPTGLTPVAAVPVQSIGKPRNSLRVYTFQSERMHSFDLAIIPDSLNRNKELQGFLIRYFYPGKLQTWSADVMAVASQILGFYQKRYGLFPGKSLTIVAGQDNKLQSINGHLLIVLDNHFSRLENKLGITKLSEALSYAIAQQYWGGRVLASNRELPWLTQGFATYLASKYMQKRQLLFAKSTQSRQAYVDIASRGWNTSLTTSLDDLAFMPFDSFKVLAQGKGYTFIKMLEQLLGKAIVQKIEASIQKKYLFIRPPDNALQAETEAISKKELGWFFSQWKSSATLDYAIQAIDVSKQEGQYQATITVLRLGQIIMPVSIDIVLESGEHMFRLWNGDKHSERLTFKVPSNIKEIRLDPAKILPDVNRRNNVMLNKKPLIR